MREEMWTTIEFLSGWPYWQTVTDVLAPLEKQNKSHKPARRERHKKPRAHQNLNELEEGAGGDT